MKTTISTLILMSALTLSAVDVPSLTKELKGNDKHIVDEARMTLQIAPDNAGETALLNAFKAQKDENLKAGIAYSLGKMQSKKAFSMLSSAAKDNGIVGEAAILALAEYKDKAALKALRALKASAQKNPVRENVIQIALDLAEDSLSNKTYLLEKVPATFDKMDDNEKVVVLRTLTITDKNKKFLLEQAKKDNADRVNIAIIVGLRKHGGLDAMQTVFAIKEKQPKGFDFQYADTIANIKGKGTDEFLAEKVKAGDTIAINAAAMRGLSCVEDKLLENIDTKGNLKGVSFNALEDLGTIKTVEKLLKNMESSDRDYVQRSVKVLAKAITRLDDNSKAKMKSITEKYSKNAKENQDAYTKVLAFF